MNKTITTVAAMAVIYWLYSNQKNEQSTNAFLSGGDYNDIYSGQWFS